MKKEFELEPWEYRKIVTEINSKYHAVYEGQYICTHVSFGIDGIAYVYWFENHGFDNYRIFMRTVDNH